MTTVPGEQAPQPTRKLPSNLTQRIITGAVVLPFILLAAVLGGWLFTLLAGALALVGVAEFCLLPRERERQGSVIVAVPVGVAVMLAFHFHQHALWAIALLVGAVATFILETIRHPHNLRLSVFQVAMTLGGVLYVAFPTGFLIGLRALPDGLTWLLLVFMLTWGTDSFAYIGGRLWGRTLLAPTISPKKTREGAVVGIIGGIIPSIILLLLTQKLTVALAILVAIGPLVAILGDLVESLIKRVFGVKDSHIEGFDVLPGHGGVLDRVDALILVTTLCYVYLYAFVLA